MSLVDDDKLKTKAKKFERKYYLDWLRVIAVISVFFYHLAGMYSVAVGGAFRNDEVSIGMDLFIILLAGFGMPMFFIISGMGAFYAFKYVEGFDGKIFIKERFVRLMVPFLFGLFTHIPVQLYFVQVGNSRFTGSFLEFIPHYFDGISIFGGAFPQFGLHLWTLLYLFFDCLIAVALFVYLSKVSNQEKLGKFASYFNKPGAIYLFVVPLLIIEIFDPLTAFGIVRFTGWNALSYLTFLIIGFFLASDKQYEESLEKHNLAAFFILIFCVIIGLPMAIFILNQPITRVVMVFYGWSVLILILNLGRKHLNIKHSIMKFLSKVSLPFYIIHQTVLVIIAFFLIPLDLAIALEFLLISTISLAIIFGLIFIIMQLNALRFLFGMRLKKKKEKESPG